MSSEIPYENDQLLGELKKLIREDDRLKLLQVTDEYYMRFLLAADFQIPEAFLRIKTFYELLEELPDWFTTSSCLNKKDLIKKDMRIVPDACDKEGRRLYIVKLGNIDSSLDLIQDIIPIDDIFAEYLLLEKYPPLPSVKGLCVLIDVSNFSIKLMKYLTPFNIKTIIRRIQSMPIKSMRYHVVNNSLMVQMAVKTVWAFLPENVREAVNFHFNDANSLYDHIDKENLPSEYGGVLELNVSKCHGKIFEKTKEIEENFVLTRRKYLDSLNLIKCSNEVIRKDY